MIQFGPTLGPDSKKIPKIVFEWVSSRNKLFPTIDFKIDHFTAHESQREEFSEIAKKYSQTYLSRWKESGIYSVAFPFLSETWIVTIIGGIGPDGKLVGKTSPDYPTLKPLTPLLRNEIAGLKDAEGVAMIDEKAVGISRSGTDKVLNVASELTEVTPDIWYENR